MFISQTIFSEPTIEVAKKQPWTSSTNLEHESLMKKQWLWKDPVEKENAEQRTGNVCEEEDEDVEEDENVEVGDEEVGEDGDEEVEDEEEDEGEDEGEEEGDEDGEEQK